MKIMHVCKKYPDALGGDAVVVANLEKQQKMSGNEVIILTSNCDEIKSDKHIYKFGIKDTPSNLDNITFKRLLSLVTLFFKSYKIIKSERPDVIHAHSVDMAFFVSFAARHYKIPIIHTFHIVTFNDPRQQGIRSRVELFLLRHTKPKRITVLNPNDIKDFEKAGFDNVVFIPNGVDTDFWKPLKNVKKNKRFTFIAVGRLEEQKGFTHLIEAAAKLKKDGNDFQIQIVGEGSLEDQLANQIQKLNLEKDVYLLGRKSPTELRKLYNQANVFVLSSLWEGMPLTLLEAWASGLPTICTRVNGIGDLVADGSLLILPSNDHELSISMERTLKDRKLTMSSQSSLQSVINNYSWLGVWRKLESEYRNLAQVKKIVQITPYYPPHVGGVEQRVKDLSTRLAKIGYDVTVLTSRPKGVGFSAVQEGVRVRRLSSVEFAHTPIIFWLFFHVLFLKKPTIVHLHIAQAFAPEIAALACRIRKIPYIAHYRMDVDASGPMGFVLPLYKKICVGPVLRGSEKIIVLTPDYLQLVSDKYDIDKSKVSIIPNATSFKRSTAKHDVNSPMRLLFVGRLAKQKNPMLLVEAMHLLNDMGFNFTLKIVGDGELRDEISNYIENNNLRASVMQVGTLIGDKLESAYEESDVFIMTSVAESFGTVLIEAMSKGLPIICPNIPAIRNTIIDNRNGILVELNAEQVVLAITKLSHDKLLFRKISQNNIKDSRNYNWDGVINKTISVYDELMR